MELSVAAQPPLRLAPCHLVALLPSPCHTLHCRLLSHRPPFLRPPVHPTVRFLRESLERAGCAVSDEFFSARRCDEQAGGGFMPGEGVVVCANHVGGQDEVDVVVAHELVHALDHCRAKNLHWPDLQHHACSEIRAANLSGACHMHREFNTRGSDFVFRNGHPQCVRRKAQLSVAMNPFCSDTPPTSATATTATATATTTTTTTTNGSSANGSSSGSEASSSSSAACMARARAAVDAVWDVCYHDTTPFDRIP
ncbi:unnamed protein product [Closterium sp. Naga37s-1]|nr:unnamed protein product [Closterium sp. Naga37s-1]